MPILANPLALIGLLTVGGLVGIYFLHSRPRKQEVSSLMLWHIINRSQGQGRKLQKMQMPLLFLLEILILLMLVLSAASPLIYNRKVPRLVVVLDNSFSMQAGDNDSPRMRAEKHLRKLLKSRKYATSFIMAGHDAKFLESDDLSGVMKKWNCTEGMADINKALGLARRVSGNSRILVLTDHAPGVELAEGKILWQGFGDYLPNLAITTATRKTDTDKSRVLVKVSNFSDKPQTTSLKVSAENGATPKVSSLFLPAETSKTLRFELPASAGLIKVTLDHDALAYDNSVFLLPEKERKIGAAVRVSDEKLKTLIKKALAASGLFDPKSSTAIIFTDNPKAPAPRDAWRVIFTRPSGDKESLQAVIGPFVTDSSHPLCQGVSLDGVIWTFDKTGVLPGAPIISAGDSPLITELYRSGASRDIYVNLVAGPSSLHLSPDWPIFIHNIAAYRIDNLPGPAHQNVHLDEIIKLNLPQDIEKVFLYEPAGDKTQPVVANDSCSVQPWYKGMWKVESVENGGKKQTWSLAVNATNSGESDLAKALTGSWGKWNETEDFASEYTDLSFISGCAALVLLMTHLLLSRKFGGVQ